MEASAQGLSLLEKKAIGDRSQNYYQQEYTNTSWPLPSPWRSLWPPLLRWTKLWPSTSTICFSKASWTPGRQNFGFFDAPQTRLQPAWQQRPSTCLACPEGLAPFSAWQQPPGLSSGYLGSNLQRDEVARAFADGLVHHDVFVGLRQTWRTFEMPSGQFDQAIPRGDRNLVTSVEPGGVPAAIQDRRVRRQPVIDSPYMKHWAPPLMQQLTSRNKRLPLWSFDYGRYSQIFALVTKPLRLDISPYSLRRSGPSVDRNRGLRSLLEVQKRGRWKSYKCVARYEKSARLASNFQLLSQKHQQHCLHAETRLGEVMSGRARPPPLL